MKNFRIVIYLSFALLLAMLPLQEIFPYEPKNNYTYGQFIQIYKERLGLENEVFKMLSFKLCSMQPVREGQRVKFTLEDNLGRKWIFKPNIEKKEDMYNFTRGEIAVVVYHLYKLFGLETPQVHYTALNINGRKISGSIQEFISSKGTLCGYPPDQLSAGALNYFLKSHVLDWLFVNYDSSPTNFLVLSFNAAGKPEKIMRIDNETAFVLSDNDKLKYDWICPWHEHPFTKYYYRLWENYVLKTIDLKPENNFAFIKFVSEFPDDFFKKLILPLKTHDFKILIQPEFERFGKKHNNFLENTINKKHNLIRDFKKFYSDLSEKRGEVFRFNKNNRGTVYIIASISRNLTEEINKLEKDKLKLKKAPSHHPEISVVFSPEGFLHLSMVYRRYWKEKGKEIISVCDSALQNLNSLEASAENKYERNAIKIYIKEVKKIRSGKPPSFRFSEINKVVQSVIPEN